MNERTIFLEALDKDDPTERFAFLDTACAGDEALRRRVDSLLKSHVEAGSFLGKLAPERVAEELALKHTADETQGEVPENDKAGANLDFLAPSDKPGVLGRFAHYDILEVIGRGGMGIVLRAFDEKLHRVVAIKVMAAQLATNAIARKRFRREAQAAAAVSHVHIVTIHAVDEANGLPYLVMHYVAGVSLQERLDKSGPLQLQEILRIGMQTASGLAAAHAQGLIHRDIKPSNILLENGIERVQVTDFGLARAATEASLTQSGVVAGTPQYMSPEQAEGKAIDQRSDLFSLGSVLYAMCTGRAPFRASGTMAVLKRVCEETPRPIRETNPDIPDWLVAVIDNLHAKDPAGRYQTAAEVAELLNQHLAHLQHPSIAPLPVTRPAKPAAAWRRRVVAAVLLLCLALGGVGLGFYLQRDHEPSSPGNGHHIAGTGLVDAKTNLLVQDALLWMTFEKSAFYSKDDATYVHDLSGHGRDGICEKCEFTSAGQVGGALRLKGGELKVPHRLLNNHSEYTVAAWIFFNDLPTVGFPLMQEFVGPKMENFTLCFFHHGVFTNAWNRDHRPDQWKGSLAELGVHPGQWNFVAVRLKNGGLDKGELLVTRNDKTVLIPSQMQSGPATGYATFGQSVEGMLDELLVLPRALSDDEVRLLYELGKKGRSPEGKTPPAKMNPQPFVILDGKSIAERKFDTLADAVQGASDGDTIEVRGNGPFVTEPIKITLPLTIRAGEGFRPVIKLSPEGLQARAPLLETEAALVLEGLELQRMAQDRKGGPPYQVVLTTWKDLHVANCRFLMSKTPICIHTSSPVSELRNCELICADQPAGAMVYMDFHHSGQRLAIDNCLLTDVARVSSHEQYKVKGAFVQLTRNTFRTRAFWFYQVLDKEPNPKNLDQRAKLLSIETSGNIFDGSFVFRFEQDPPDKRLTTRETESYLAHTVGWVGERNLYAVAGPFLLLDTTFKPTTPVKNLVDWKRLWATAEANSIEGRVKYQGGDLLAKLEATPEQLTPDDFRLHPHSAGYEAGKDGKDLGANVDLVGPGTAYERWKKTPEYQQWLKDTKLVTNAEATKPVLRMHFDKADFYEKDGKTYVRDHSGKGNDGLCEQVQFTPEGKTGGGLANAGKGFLRLPTSFVAGRSRFTIAAWVKRTNLANSWAVYSCLPKDYPTRELPAFNFFCTNHLYVGAWHPASDWVHASALNATISPGEWVFVAVTLENGAPGKGRLQLMLNDRFAQKSLQQVGGGPLEEIQDIAALKLEGVFDELAVWHRALTEQELREVFALHQPGSKK